MVHRATLIGVLLLSAAVMVCGWWGGSASEAVFSAVAAAFPGVLIAIGVCRKQSLGPLALPLAILVTVLEGSVFGLLLISRFPAVSASAGVGWPLAVMVCGLWVVPLVVVTVSYAATFDRWVLSDEDLQQFERRRRRLDEHSE